MNEVHLLIVDDDPNLLEGLRRSLSRSHREWTVWSAGNGVEAIGVIARRPIGAVVTDLIMPEMEGIETIQYLRRHRPDLPIVAMSGGGRHLGPSSLRIARLMGAHETLEKPFDPALLVETLERLIERSSRNEGIPR